MLICNRCEKLKREEDLEYVTEMHGERHLDYTCSCGGEYDEATKCKLCGEWFNNDFLHGICEYCMEEEETVGNALAIGEYSTVKREINGFVADVLTDEQINKILIKWVEENFTDHSKPVWSYLESDKGAFCEYLEEKRGG